MAMTGSFQAGGMLQLQAFSANTTVNDSTDSLLMTSDIDLRHQARMASSSRGDLFIHVSTITGSPVADAVVEAILFGKWTEIGRSSDLPGAVGYWRVPLTYETLGQCNLLRVTWENTTLDGSNNFVATAASSYYHFAP